MDFLGSTAATSAAEMATSLNGSAANCFLTADNTSFINSNPGASPSSTLNKYSCYPVANPNSLGAPTSGTGLASPSSSSNSSLPPISVILTVRLLMQGKEVGSIIGKRGDHVKLIRDKSGAKVNISDGSCPERIVTITGNTSTINAAFAMVARKFEEDLQALPNSVPKPPITMRLIVPATQCGSLIGKGGSKIKEIREKTGASIQVATEMLPSSTERAVTISGTCEAISDCMNEVCQILLEAPPKGATLPFRPKPSYNPLMVASSAAAAAAAQQQASQHIAAALLQQQQQTQGQFGQMHSANQIPTTNSTNAALQELARLNPASFAFVDVSGIGVPASSSSSLPRPSFNSGATDLAAILGSLPGGANLSSMMGLATTNGINAQMPTSAYSNPMLSNMIQNPNASSLQFGSLDPTASFIHQQQQAQGQANLQTMAAIWQQQPAIGAEKQQQQQQMMAAAMAQQQQQSLLQQHYDLLQSLGYQSPAAYTLNNNGTATTHGGAMPNTIGRNLQSCNGTSIPSTKQKQQDSNGSGATPGSITHSTSSSTHTKSTRFSPY